MKPTGAIYLGEKNRKYFVIYNYHHDVHVMLPPELRNLTDYVEHFTYKRGNKMGGGCVFEFKQDVKLEDYKDRINLRKIFTLKNGVCDVNLLSNHNKNKSFGANEFKDTKKIYDIQYEFSSKSSEIRKELIKFTDADVEYFCREKTAKNPRGSKIEIVEEIIPKTKIKEINPPKGFMLQGGKQEFTPTCVYEANIDYGADCFSNCFSFGSNLIFKLKNGETVDNIFAYPWGECDYCYAQEKHRESRIEPGYGNFFRTIFKFDKKNLEKELKGECCLTTGSYEKLGRPVKNLRFGKRTEAFAPIFYDRFVQTLEAMVESGTRGVATNKFLFFDSEVAELFKKTKSSVPFSIGDDSLELGACEHGCNNEWRFEQYLKYNEVGVLAFPYLLVQAHKEPTKKQEKLIEYIKKKNLIAQILPMRFYKRKELVKKITGQEWDFLKGRKEQESFEFMEREKGSYYIVGGNQLSPIIKKMHPYWIGLVGNNKGNIRMCHHDSELTYCGACFLGKGGIYKTPYVKKIKGLKNKDKTKRAKTKNNLIDLSQKNLF